MQVPLLDLNPQLKSIESEIKQAVLEVIESGRYIMGPGVEKLEKEIASYVGCSHAAGVSSGTDALLIALMALNIRPGDIVITTPYSFIATAGVIARLQAIPAFVDIAPDSFNMDPESLLAWFQKEKNKRTSVKAIIPIHLFGQCADMDPIVEIGAEYGIPVIEDAAQAIGATYPSKDGTRKAGGIGTAGCFSFFPSKNLGAMGDAGMVVTNDADLAEKISLLRNHGTHPKYHHDIIGGNFRLDEIQAAVLLTKLPHLDNWHAKRRQNATYYDTNLRHEAIRTPAISYDRDSNVYNQYIVSVSPEKRDALKAYLTSQGIGVEIYYPLPFHLQNCFAHLGYKNGDFPASEYAAQTTIALPIYPELTRPMQDYVINHIHEFFTQPIKQST